METLVTRYGIARVEGDELAVVDLPLPNLRWLFKAGQTLADVETAPVTRRLAKADLDEVVVPPLGLDTAVWGVGLNYHGKAALTGRPVPTEPILFLKPSSALAAHRAALPIPADLTTQFDYEAEVGIVLARALHDARPEDVWDAVGGVIAANDSTARDVMKATGTPTLAKGFPGCAPLGPTMLPPSDLADRDAIPVASWVDGEERQRSSTADLIFDVPELLSRLSRYVRLEPGDVVLTGTPPGTGQDRNDYLRPGQEIRIAVGPLVPLVNTVA
ncbi:fumarylacetoacetate hydrolase family protein [Cryptosporangium aurantiacum]|uniref:2-keto-4-pentenoate hydratase/2-oxohepta-3-ene-1,7-dioic acid hydratase (Catechol pathway) n=1 Tax=Cryptosporangium aurantiacum TaxID=134849 RepID=A0A1M7MJS9_9ACTN|nr:fumarylacetoacetate hydrolase family protein [Cryptosporangium aurantiacum]SHM91122.1 2-keto-4-pentenoate hydratase/2-oxohepta-3-ene-1,7-dioic acid hydratase (catechol pathway) [Cryptosporangium aurantiacum]